MISLAWEGDLLVPLVGGFFFFTLGGVGLSGGIMIGGMFTLGILGPPLVVGQVAVLMTL